jgi:hypothetical protein
MRQALLPCAMAALAFACAPAPPSAQGLNRNALDAAIGAAIGDPATCVLLADRASGQVVYRYGEAIECARALPACDRPGTMTVQGALTFATVAGGRFASCPSVPDGSRTVGWAAARAPNAKHDLVYSAVMEGQRALPGHEINARLGDAFAAAGV